MSEGRSSTSGSWSRIRRVRPSSSTCARVNRGEQENQEGYFLQGILAGEQWVYVNPFVPARLYDDEVAIATCLAKMADYAGGGPGFYGLPDASHDHYLGMLLEQAVSTGEPVASEPQPWT